MLNAMKTADYILASLIEPVLILDSGLRAVTANPAFFQTLKIEPDLLVGKAVHELLTDERGPPQLRAVLGKVMEHGGDLAGAEILCTIPPDAEAVLFVNARRMKSVDDIADWVIVELRDVTKERELTKKLAAMNEVVSRRSADLEHLNRELDSFAHSISHDLRTPLRLTNRVGHMLLEDHAAELSTGAVDLVKMILASTDEMAKLIESILAFSQASREPLRRKPIDTAGLAREAVDDLRNECEGRDVKFIVGDLAPCQADRTLLKQVMLNLLENALKFTRERPEPEIQIGCTRNADETVYFVRDNGIGFDAQQSESMFVVFRRLHQLKKVEGLGIGLALVKRIIERHGGRIWADGEVNRGATFYFTLSGDAATVANS